MDAGQCWLERNLANWHQLEHQWLYRPLHHISSCMLLLFFVVNHRSTSKCQASVADGRFKHFALKLFPKQAPYTKYASTLRLLVPSFFKGDKVSSKGLFVTRIQSRRCSTSTSSTSSTTADFVPYVTISEVVMRQLTRRNQPGFEKERWHWLCLSLEPKEPDASGSETHIACKSQTLSAFATFLCHLHSKVGVIKSLIEKRHRTWQ